MPAANQRSSPLQGALRAWLGNISDPESRRKDYFGWKFIGPIPRSDSIATEWFEIGDQVSISFESMHAAVFLAILDNRGRAWQKKLKAAQQIDLKIIKFRVEVDTDCQNPDCVRATALHVPSGVYTSSWSASTWTGTTPTPKDMTTLLRPDNGQTHTTPTHWHQV